MYTSVFSLSRSSCKNIRNAIFVRNWGFVKTHTSDLNIKRIHFLSKSRICIFTEHIFISCEIFYLIKVYVIDRAQTRDLRLVGENLRLLGLSQSG